MLTKKQIIEMETAVACDVAAVLEMSNGGQGRRASNRCNC